MGVAGIRVMRVYEGIKEDVIPGRTSSLTLLHDFPRVDLHEIKFLIG